MPTTVPYRVGDEPVAGFRLLAFLGRGGFGEVWKASAPGGTEIALKLIRLDDATGLKEFRSLRLVKRLRHPNLVPIVAYWLKDQDGLLLTDEAVAALSADPSTVETARWSKTPGAAAPQPAIAPAELIIAMGLGETNLTERLRQCQASGVYGLPDVELLAFFADAARAIDYLNRPMHDLGSGPVAIQHCDVKPQNMLIVGGALQLCDFGLASMLGDVRTTSAAAGTIAYAAPECFRDGKPSASTDQYSLAVSYYELRTGTLPYDATSVAQISQAVIQGELNFLRVALPEQQVLRRATALDPRKRFATATAMVQALAEAAALDASADQTTAIRPVATRKPRWRAFVAGVAGACLLTGLAVWQYPWSSAPDYLPSATILAGTPAAVSSSTLPAKRDQPHDASPPVPDEPPPAADLSTEPASEFTNALDMRLVLIPAGEFLMGTSEAIEPLAAALGPLPAGFNHDDEHPEHRVKINQPFYLGANEVTVAQFRKFVAATDYQTDAERDDRGGWGYDQATQEAGTGPQFTWRDWGVEQTDESPVANVSWNDAQAFCAWLSGQEKRRYRLPTEAEWEYACRAGTTTRFSSGDLPADLPRVANVLDLTTLERMPRLGSEQNLLDGWAFTAPVASLAANPFGLHDMHGNLAEWCADGYSNHYYESAPLEDPPGPGEAEYRILRGGSWIHPPVRCRSAYRGFDAPEFRSGYVGFRVVCEPRSDQPIDE